MNRGGSAAVFDSVHKDLIENKIHPFHIGEHSVIKGLQLKLDPACNHILRITAHSGIHKLAQGGGADQIILFYAVAPRVKEGLLQIVFNPAEIFGYARRNSSRGVFQRELGRGKRRFYLVHPGFNIFAVFLLLAAVKGNLVVHRLIADHQRLIENSPF